MKTLDNSTPGPVVQYPRSEADAIAEDKSRQAFEAADRFVPSEQWLKDGEHYREIAEQREREQSVGQAALAEQIEREAS